MKLSQAIDIESNIDFNEESNYVLQVSNISYVVKINRQQKDIFRNISLDLCSGNLYAMMGMSGAGKTSLLNVLSSRYDGLLSGEILCNEKIVRRKSKKFMKISSLITQDDILFTSFTPRESIMYAARLKLTCSYDKKVYQCESMLKKLELTGCADINIGDNTKRGISGGERKRTSIAIQLISNPSIVFLDEPTSGLDSSSALVLIEILKKLTSEGKLIVCTIHQPSWDLFLKFNELILLHLGGLIYNGKTRDIINFFESHHIYHPTTINPMDFYLNEIKNMDTCNLQRVCSTKCITRGIRRKGTMKISKNEIIVHNSILHNVWILTERYCFDYYKDRSKLMKHTFVRLIFGIILGIVYINQVNQTTQSSIQSTTGLMFMFSVLPFLQTLNTILSYYPTTKVIIKNELMNNLYSIYSYIISLFLSELLFTVMLSTILFTPTYFMAGFKAEFTSFIIFILAIFLSTMIGVFVGLMLTCYCDDAVTANRLVMPISTPAMLFSGFLIPYNSIPIYFRWVYYLSWYQYTTNIHLVNHYKDYHFSDCVGNTTLCFHSGEELLKSLNVTFDMYEYILITIGYVMICCFIASVCMIHHYR